MKNISPLSPTEEIVPENTNTQASSQESSQVAQSQSAPDQGVAEPAANDGQPIMSPAPAAEPSSQPAVENPMYQQAPSLYPTPLSPEERQAFRDEMKGSQGGMAISQFGIMLVSGVYALAVLLQLIKSLTATSFVSVLGGSFGSLGPYVWAALIVGIIQCVALLTAAYKVSRGSLAGLAFVTGVSIMILPQYILIHALSPALLQVSFRSLQTGAQFVGVVGLAVMLILAWTKERNHYN